MRDAMKIMVLVLLISGVALAAKHKTPPAPLPTAVVTAKKVFLANGGGSDLAYGTFYAEMRQWGRYQIVGSPEEADLVIELAYRVVDEGTDVHSI